MLLLQPRQCDKLTYFHFRQKQLYIERVPSDLTDAQCVVLREMTVRPNDMYKPWIANAMYCPLRGVEATVGHIDITQ